MVTAPLAIPTVHLNGTSRAVLLENHCEAMGAIRRALDALSLAAPNGRDFYPQGPEAIKIATTQHLERVKSLETIRRDLCAIAEAIDQ